MIRKQFLLNGPWPTQSPFLFCVYHQDNYPKGNGNLGVPNHNNPNPGSDFDPNQPFRMYHGQSVPGFPAHPHRGFETITIVNKGFVDHADSHGNAARYGKGDVQWMSAGSGLQHSEMFPLIYENQNNTFELFQIWLNLPAKSKSTPPGFKIFWNDEIPVLYPNGNEAVSVRLIAGNFDDTSALQPLEHSWAGDAANHVLIIEIYIAPGHQITIPKTDAMANRTLYFFEGESANLNDVTIQSSRGFEIAPDQQLVLKAQNTNARFLLLQGIPINEPVVAHGPFVMNTAQEIYQTFEDYQRNYFGGWQWESQEPTHGHEAKRFQTIGQKTTYPELG
jgi:redox-sensitive bicupin YhaK (pirin superfamily)